MELTLQDIKLFWAKVRKNGPNGCWLWLGNVAKHCGGYGTFDRRRGGVRVVRRAHRLAYELLVGPIPKGLMLRHRKCDNPPCVNPGHCEPGTAKDNSRDMVEHGRHWTALRPERIPRGKSHWTARVGTAALPRGERHPGAKLTVKKVRQIRSLYATGSLTQRNLATRFKVSQGTVWQVVTGNYWGSV